ncbi:MAG: putative heme-binding domain-containing protein, partial [Pirellulaceae bacterium]
ARKTGDAIRGAKLFYNQTLSCAKCHDPQSGDRLGPDLASRRDGVNDEFLVKSVLHPSKDIRKGFEQLIVETEKGLVFTGFRVEENKESIVIREPAGGKKITFTQKTIVEMETSKVSAMPPGLVNQLNDREQFLDLARFLMEANEGGPSRLIQLKKTAFGEKD